MIQTQSSLVASSPRYQYLYDHGASAIFGLDTVTPVAAQEVLKELYGRLGHNY